MKFSCEKYLLSMAVSTAGRAVMAKAPNPVLEGLLIEAAGGVCVTGFDMRKAIYTRFPADVAEPGSVVINSKLFTDMVRQLPDGIVNITVTDGYRIRVTCGNADYSVVGMSAEDYPDLPVVDSKNGFRIQQGILSRMISETSFAIAGDESRPIYTGALMEIENKRMTMVAVDGYRMAIRKENVEDCDSDYLRCIVPGSSLKDIEKICMSSEEPVSISVGSNHVSFTIGETVLITRKLEGDFLSYKKVIPAEYAIVLEAACSDLIRCAERVSLIIDDRLKEPLRCRFGDGELTINCATTKGKAEDCCAIEGSGNDLLIGFNNVYLLDALKGVPADRIRINLNGDSTPCILTPTDGSDKFTYMILPVRMRN